MNFVKLKSKTKLTHSVCMNLFRQNTLTTLAIIYSIEILVAGSETV